MEIILREDVPTLGRAGEVIKVREGYARNFLLPQKKAVTASRSNLKVLETQKQHLEAKREKLRQEAVELGQKISASPIVLVKQAGEEDKIFGQVTPAEIAKQLEKQGFSVDRRLIRLKEPIRKIGSHTAEVHLQADVIVSVTVDVQKK